MIWPKLPWHSEPVQVVSSIIAAWSDVSHSSRSGPGGLDSVTSVVATLNVGYFWMFANCLTSAAYVRMFYLKEERVLC